jgi:chromosomal replication initiator protein
MCALEAELPEQQFNTWVRPLQALEGAGALKLLAPNRFKRQIYKDMLNKKK